MCIYTLFLTHSHLFSFDSHTELVYCCTGGNRVNLGFGDRGTVHSEGKSLVIRPRICKYKRIIRVCVLDKRIFWLFCEFKSSSLDREKQELLNVPQYMTIEVYSHNNFCKTNNLSVSIAFTLGQLSLRICLCLLLIEWSSGDGVKNFNWIFFFISILELKGGKLHNSFHLYLSSSLESIYHTIRVELTLYTHIVES